MCVCLWCGVWSVCGLCVVCVCVVCVWSVCGLCVVCVWSVCCMRSHSHSPFLFSCPLPSAFLSPLQLGAEIQAVVQQGKLVSDDIVLHILKDELSSIGEQPVVFDGETAAGTALWWLQAVLLSPFSSLHVSLHPLCACFPPPPFPLSKASLELELKQSSCTTLRPQTRCCMWMCPLMPLFSG